jgi:selenocysteine-specific elongation factor
MALTVGTAGHIDHGKTTLVEALTGRSTDRLPEERERGISIALGYAELDLGERRLSLIDVPGHERFVRTMIAGASGVDMFLLVVAADDGVMPQSREHLTVLRALGVENGVVALTKCDLADAASRRRAEAGVRELLPEAPLVAVSARKGSGLAALREALLEAARRTEAGRDPGSADAEQPVLHVDRSFSLAGHGTIVTGTLWRGELRRGDRVRVLPAGIEARIRSLEVHDRAAESAAPRQRVAINLAGVGRGEVGRGDVVSTAAAALRPSYRLDVELDRGRRPDSGERVQVHHGTRGSPARVVALDEQGLAQLRLEAPLLAAAGERVVIRRLAPPDTLGGALVLDAAPPRHGPGPAAGRLRELRDGREPAGAEAAAQPDRGGDRAPAPAPALDRTALRAFALLRADGAQPRPPAELAAAIGIGETELKPALQALCASGHLVRLKPQLYMPAANLAQLREQALDLARRDGEVTVAGLRDRAAGSRRYAQAVLEHLDSEGVLLRQGDRHLLRRPGG